MVCIIFDITFEDGAIIEKDLNPSQSIRSSNEVARNSNKGSRVGILANPCETTKPMLRNAKLEARKGTLTEDAYRGRMH